MIRKMRYRLGLDLGTTSIGWCLVRLNASNDPMAVIRTGVRIFSDGRNPKDGSSLAVQRRMARLRRRNRDRFLRRRDRFVKTLIDGNLWPQDRQDQKALENFNPWQLRAQALSEQLTPYETGRALFHLNQRRGFKSNRKTDTKDADTGAMKQSITRTRAAFTEAGFATVGAYLADKNTRNEPIRARPLTTEIKTDEGKAKKEKSYTVYIDRQMVSDEFDAIWAAQAKFQPSVFTETLGAQLKEVLLYQRNLRPIKPGRCTLMTDEPRAARALPAAQRFRLYQEVNNLRIVNMRGEERPLSLDERDRAIEKLEKSANVSFDALRKLLSLSVNDKFNLEDIKRKNLKGNETSAALANRKLFGAKWHALPAAKQTIIVQRLLTDENEAALISWLQQTYNLTEDVAAAASARTLPAGHANLCEQAIERVLPKLQEGVVTYAEAVKLAGFDHHSKLGIGENDGEILEALPYYGEVLQRHVGFGTRETKDTLEVRLGKIANPTVHIGLNQIRVVVNALIRQYGHPAQIVVEVARDLKNSKDKRDEIQREQAKKQKKNDHWKEELVNDRGLARVSRLDLQKMQLWEELNPADPLNRKCPYTGEGISPSRLMSDEIEIEHILPYSRTLDDSLNNKTVCVRQANRDKANRTPFEAFGERNVTGYDYDEICARASHMPQAKRKKFLPDGYETWLRDDKEFLARALTDTAYISRLAKEYLSVICPANQVWVVTGRLTSMLRAKLGLNAILGHEGIKNRDDHRHHAVDAAVIAVTDRKLLQAVANASARSENTAYRLVDDMPLPWPTYRESVSRAVNQIWVSHKPDHGYQGQMMLDTAYGLLPDGQVVTTKGEAGERYREIKKRKVIQISEAKAVDRHGTNEDGSPKPYKGYDPSSNFCIEITSNEKGKWKGSVISRFQAYQLVRHHGEQALQSMEGKDKFRLMQNDYLSWREESGENKALTRLFRVQKIKASGQVFLVEHFEANAAARIDDKKSDLKAISKAASSLQKLNAKKVTVSPHGLLQTGRN